MTDFNGISLKVLSVLNEIAAALDRLLEKNENWTIFSNKMPLNQEEREFLRGYLGQGNITIKMTGTDEPAEWQESGVSGVWYGVYYDQNCQPILETIEVAFFPQVPKVQVEDLQQGIAEFRVRLSNANILES